MVFLLSYTLIIHDNLDDTEIIPRIPNLDHTAGHDTIADQECSLQYPGDNRTKWLILAKDVPHSDSSAIPGHQ